MLCFDRQMIFNYRMITLGYGFIEVLRGWGEHILILGEVFSRFMTKRQQSTGNNCEQLLVEMKVSIATVQCDILYAKEQLTDAPLTIRIRKIEVTISLQFLILASWFVR